MMGFIMTFSSTHSYFSHTLLITASRSPSHFPDPPPHPKQSSYFYVYFVSLCVHAYVSLIRAYGTVTYRNKGNLPVAKLLKKNSVPPPA